MLRKQRQYGWEKTHRLIKLPNGIKWSQKPVKVLGLHIGWDMIKADRQNISEKIINIKKLVYSWKHRKLTLNGKVLVIKSLAVSQIIHLASLISISNDFIKELEQLFYEFIRKGVSYT